MNQLCAPHRVPLDVMTREVLAAEFEESAFSTLIASGIHPWRGRLTLSATTAGRHRSRLLHVPATAAILLLESTITDANDRAVLAAKHHLRHDVVELSLLQEP
jgi:DNA-binding GntR family transcriptional regulator